MGLDALDLCFRLEKKFGIKIPLEEGLAAFFDTPTTLHHYLVAKVKGECREIPAVEPVARTVLKAVNRVAGWWRLKTSTNLNKQFSQSYRLTAWAALEKELDVSLPPLEQSPGEKFPRIPAQCDSILNLTYWIIEHYPDRVKWLPVSCVRIGKMADRTWTDGEVWEAMCDCMVDALGVKRTDITPNARMIEDLGIG
jgi:hypothetical protein